jgi:hypothetical protein
VREKNCSTPGGGLHMSNRIGRKWGVSKSKRRGGKRRAFFSEKKERVSKSTRKRSPSFFENLKKTHGVCHIFCIAKSNFNKFEAYRRQQSLQLIKQLLKMCGGYGKLKFGEIFSSFES